jgi:hypothetical protein
MLRASLLALRKNPLRNHLHFYCMVTAQCFIFYVKELAARGATSAGGTPAATAVRPHMGFMAPMHYYFTAVGWGLPPLCLRRCRGVTTQIGGGFASWQRWDDAKWGWFYVVAPLGRRKMAMDLRREPGGKT